MGWSDRHTQNHPCVCSEYTLLPKRTRALGDQHRLMSVHEATPLRGQITVYRLRLADAAADLGTAPRQRGGYAEAGPPPRPALALYESCCGPGHARIAAPLSALGTACAARGRPGEAERLCRRALDLIGTRTSERS